MLENKKRDMTPFDMAKPPVKQRTYLLPLVWGAAFAMTRRNRLKIHKVNMNGIRPPFLVLATHQGFSDYYIAPLALFPYRANYVSDMEGFAAFGERLYRGIGCIGKRRYVHDAAVVKNIRKALKNGCPVVVYPESRHSNAGITAELPDNLGLLAKKMNVPLVVLTAHGSYLANPFWDEERARRVPLEATLECLYTAEQLAAVSDEEIQCAVSQRLQYDEYEWQRASRLKIGFAERAEGLEKVLYRCDCCGTEHMMSSRGSALECGTCGARWEMDEYGTLNGADGQVFIPDWYGREREAAEKRLADGDCFFSYSVRVEALPNSKGFVPLGSGTLTLDKNGFTLNVGETVRSFPHLSRESVQTEYNYRGRGACIVLSDRDCCYYIYSGDKTFQPTFLQFAGEYLHKMKKRAVVSKNRV